MGSTDARLTASASGACCWIWLFLSKARSMVDDIVCDRFALYTRFFPGPCRLQEVHARECQHFKPTHQDA